MSWYQYVGIWALGSVVTLLGAGLVHSYIEGRDGSCPGDCNHWSVACWCWAWPVLIPLFLVVGCPMLLAERVGKKARARIDAEAKAESEQQERLRELEAELAAIPPFLRQPAIPLFPKLKETVKC